MIEEAYVDRIKPLKVTQDIKVKGYDIDVMGIVSNIVYLKWFEDLRQELLERYYPFRTMFTNNRSPILARTEVEYLKPITIYDDPHGILWVSDLGKVRWTVKIEIICQEHVCCRGVQSGYFYDVVKKRPVRMPQELLKKYKEELNIK
jgi:acyl-CoA thioester hydrolase